MNSTKKTSSYLIYEIIFLVYVGKAKSRGQEQFYANAHKFWKVTCRFPISGVWSREEHVQGHLSNKE